MITKQFKAILAMMLTSVGSSTNTTAVAQCKKTDGTTVYLTSRSDGFPSSVSTGITTSANNSGICIGRGSTPATEDDYMLESLISSGFSYSTPSKSEYMDDEGNPCLSYSFTITNTGSSDLTISEIGYIQERRCGTTKGSIDGYTNKFLIDRTVLDSPISIPVNGYAAVKYTLKTII